MAKDYDSRKSLPRNKWGGDDIQVANWFTCVDATATPLVSPLTLANTNTTSIVIPSDAVEVVLYSNNNLKVGVVSDLASYYTLQANIAEVFPVSLINTLYIATTSAGSIVNFRFINV